MAKEGQAQSRESKSDPIGLRAKNDEILKSGKKQPVTGPLVRGKGKLGPRFPKDKNPHDLLLS